MAAVRYRIFVQDDGICGVMLDELGTTVRIATSFTNKADA
jgi:hypothetical protein